MMVAQLELRAKRLDNAESALKATLQLSPSLKDAVTRVEQEVWHRRRLGFSDHERAAEIYRWLTPKDPWLGLRPIGMLLSLFDTVETVLRYPFTLLAQYSEAFSDKFSLVHAPLRLGSEIKNCALGVAQRSPRLTLLMRKLFNAVPCMLSGVASRAISEYGWRVNLRIKAIESAVEATGSIKTGSSKGGGSSSNHQGSWAAPQQFHFQFQLILLLLGGHSYSMWTEYMVVDCMVLLFMGGLIFPLIIPPPKKPWHIGPIVVQLRKK
uniref:Uncharacterized protein n=2 Tax=Octactis speculum TaxID=3111310 RepID=A0A7S2BP83_9STRA|mmetsp:Transcript_25513/g.35075  ORF Transcript_25513/g.35075 Transcript_25513/m.35075 type:complete len:266 (+) Transcript_25513:43-840(+)